MKDAKHKKENLVSIADVPEGNTVNITKIEGGWNYRKRVTGLGFIRGCDVRVIKNSAGGPLMVEVKGAKFALGRGEAGKIFVNKQVKQ